jgi:hypothetical protein
MLRKGVTDYFANTDFARLSFSSIAVELTSGEVTDYPFIFGYGSTASGIMVIEAALEFSGIRAYSTKLVRRDSLDLRIARCHHGFAGHVV